MKKIEESTNKARWPRTKVKSVECRESDLVIRITDWMKDKDEPAYDVEVYIGGVYDWNESQSFTMHKYGDKSDCKRQAVLFAQSQIARLL